MKKVLFFIHNGWIFGKIHNELIKALYPEVYCDILEWNTSYSSDTFNYLLEKYDYFFTTVDGAIHLNRNYNVPYEKIVACLHAMWDIREALKNQNFEKKEINLFKGYVSTSLHLTNVSITYEIKRIPKLLELGLWTENYKNNLNLKKDTLDTIGYTGKIHFFYDDIDIKRGNLVKKIANLTKTNLFHKETPVHFLSAEKLYSNFDLLIFSSLHEGTPCPLLEAYASGIPVLGTSTGRFPEMIKRGSGYILPFDENEFVEEGIKIVNLLKKEKSTFLRMKEAAYEESKKFDWKIVREDWINYINNLN